MYIIQSLGGRFLDSAWTMDLATHAINRLGCQIVSSYKSGANTYLIVG